MERGIGVWEQRTQFDGIRLEYFQQNQEGNRQFLKILEILNKISAVPLSEPFLHFRAFVFTLKSLS